MLNRKMAARQKSKAIKKPERKFINEQKCGSAGNNVAHQQAFNLFNLLKHRRARQWISYEWFYSNIDETFFSDGNDFNECLRQSFPLLKTRQLTRIEWNKIRRLLGKPRRCSTAFFLRERMALEQHRRATRLLQTAHAFETNEISQMDFDGLRCRTMPRQLSIGNDVNIMLPPPSSSPSPTKDANNIGSMLRSGIIQAIHSAPVAYDVQFNSGDNLETCTVPDFEINLCESLVVTRTSHNASSINRDANIVETNHSVKLLNEVCLLKKCLKQKQEKLHLLSLCHNEIHARQNLTEQGNGDDHDNDNDDGLMVMEITQHLYRDIAHININILEHFETIMGSAVGREAVAVRPVHKTTSAHLTKDVDKNVANIANCKEYPMEVQRLLNGLAKLLCVLMEQKESANCNNNSLANMRANAIENVKNLIAEDNFRRIRELLDSTDM